MVKYLLNKGADANAINTSKGQTPLHCACNGGHAAVVEMLLRRPEVISSVNATTMRTSSTPLHCVAHSGKPDSGRICAMLLRHGALVDPRDRSSNTPLLFATKCGNIGAVDTLVRAGANPNTEDAEGDTPLLIACALGSAGIVRSLLKAGVSPQGQPLKGNKLPPLHLAARSGSVDVVKELISAGARIDAPSRLGRSALHLAAMTGFPEVVQYLLSQRANIDAIDEDSFTPLAHATQGGNDTIVDILLKAGADPNVPASAQSWTPLHFAAMENMETILGALLASPLININAADKENRTALHWAAFNGEMSVVLALLEHEADAAVPDSGKRTPGVIAAAKGFEEIAELLHRRAGADPAAMSKKKISSNTLSSYWVMNSASQSCMGCAKKFTFTNRRHHCRECRKLFCNTCSSARMPRGHRLAGMRVCNDCFDREHQRPRTTSNASLAPLALHPTSNTNRIILPPEPAPGHASRHQQHHHKHSSHAAKAPEVVHFPEIAHDPSLNTAYLEDILEKHRRAVEAREEDDNRLYMQEFQAFSQIGKKNNVSASKEHPDLNRYKDILAYDHTRVSLSHAYHSTSDYINASYIGGSNLPKRYIACQGPLPGTATAFWQMVWEQKASVIVMLACLREGRSIKCHQYWPDMGSG